MSRLRLKDVTVAAADCLHPALAARALDISLDRCDFADAILFSDVPAPGSFRHQTIAPLKSLDDYTRFCLQEMPTHIATGFVLLVQWDGYVLDPTAWSADCLRYDYIGAPYLDPLGGGGWIVGNGGFSLRSRRLLAALPALPVVPGLNEDRIICQTFRGALERDHGIRFAPERLADVFSYEQRAPTAPTFGFHGVFNLHRAEDDATVMAMIDGLTRLEVADGRLVPLLNQCLKAGRRALAAAVYGRVRGATSHASLRTIAARLYGSAEFADRLLADLDALAADAAGGP